MDTSTPNHRDCVDALRQSIDDLTASAGSLPSVNDMNDIDSDQAYRCVSSAMDALRRANDAAGQLATDTHVTADELALIAMTYDECEVMRDALSIIQAALDIVTSGELD